MKVLLKKMIVILVILLFVNMPVVLAAEINNTNNSATAASSEDTLITGTLNIKADLPKIIKGDKLDITGETEAGSLVTMRLDGQFSRVVTAGSEGKFSFPQVILKDDEVTKITIEAKKDNRLGTVEAEVFADNTPPNVQFGELPELAEEKTIELNGKISEQADYEILVNGKSLKKGNGVEFTEKISLEEGSNEVIVKLTDEAGWETEKKITLASDTQAPQVTASIAKGNEYYETRASSDISGVTEAGAQVYLYVYRPLGYEFKPDFKKAREKVTADLNGSFIFKDVNMESSLADISLEDLAPRVVPSELLNVQIPKQIEGGSSTTFYLYIIAEDKTGKVSSAWQQTVTVRSCFAGDLAFTVSSVEQFQTPTHLNPEQLDAGKQEIQAVFQLEYNGDGIANANTGEPGFKINTIDIQKACTQGMLDDPFIGAACKLMLGSPKTITNHDRTAIYATWSLGKADNLLKKEDNFWDDLKKRELVFPLKIQISYQERQINNDGTETLSSPKTQTSCTDLGYMVDIPLESKELLPDWLAEDSLSVLNDTLSVLQDVVPIIEKVYLITGITSMVSLLLKTVARWYRLFVESSEPIWTKIEESVSSLSDSGEKKVACPPKVQQNKLYLDSTLENWQELLDSQVIDVETQNVINNFPQLVLEALQAGLGTEAWNKVSLDYQCPSTASAWSFENTMQDAYRWTFDRAFCREVPAGWTEAAKLGDIGAAILKQDQCVVGGKGIPLTRREDCQSLVEVNKAAVKNEGISKEGGNVCWQDQKGVVYYRSSDDQKNLINEAKPELGSIFTLTPALQLFSGATYSASKLKVYQPYGSADFIAGRDVICKAACAQVGGSISYKPYQDGGSNSGCYLEGVVDGQEVLLDSSGNTLKSADGSKLYKAGYTQDCFINDAQQLSQCVCAAQGKTQTTEKKSNENYLRTATASPEEAKAREEYSYRQDIIYKETKGLIGTYYYDERYYSGRDLSGAFGADYIIDYLKSEPEAPTVDPHSSFVDSLQSVCLSGILKNLKMIEQFLVGTSNCITEAKFTGLQDAGMCKTWFSQQVCGLAYQSIAYLNNDCRPTSTDDVNDDGPFGDFGEYSSNFFTSMSGALQSSIDETMKDYGNPVLSQYFKGGAAGFAQSMCMGFFGFDVPLLSQDFLLDAAYAFPMESSMIVAPAWREFETYNPASDTAVYNYKIAAGLFPGCKIRTYNLKLKCIGGEDVGGLGVDTTCNGEGCDCLNSGDTGVFRGEKSYLLKSGSNLPNSQLIDIPLESPIRLDKHYRYDHVVLELFLDSAEQGNADKCFDEEAIQGNKAVYYFPLTDVSASQPECKVDTVTGQFSCSGISTLFGFGGAYFTSPFMTCWNKNTQSWVDCKSENLFVNGDEIKVRVHLNNDDQGKCLKKEVVNVAGIQQDQGLIKLPQNSPGPIYPEFVLGVVNDNLFGGSSGIFIKDAANSNSACNFVTLGTIPQNLISQNYKFRFVADADKVKVYIDNPNVQIANSVADNDGFIIGSEGQQQRILQKGTQTSFTREEINKVVFTFQGVQIYNILGNVNTADANSFCTYNTVAPSSSTTTPGERNINVRFTLYERDAGGSCNVPTQQVRSTGGQTDFTLPVHIQKTTKALQETGGLYSLFKSENYNGVINLADRTLNQEGADLSNALAAYYEAAAYVMTGSKEGNVNAYKDPITKMLNLFFKRDWVGFQLEPYPAQLQNSGEYKKVRGYMCELAVNYDYILPADANCPFIS